MVSTPTCDFRCWQAALRLKGFSFRGPKFGEWIQIVGGRNLLPNCKLNELIKEMENRLGIVIKVCRLILLGDLGGLVRRLYHNPGHVFRIRFFSTPVFLMRAVPLLNGSKKNTTDFLPSVESLLLRRGVAIPQSRLVNWVPEKNQHPNPETGPQLDPINTAWVWRIPRQVCHDLCVPAPFYNCQLNPIRNDPFLVCMYISIHFSTL